jgi:hypothetical protein
MNAFQEQWWRQAASDHGIFVLLRREGAAACHALHYLQMATEKLGKAYFWRTERMPPRSHAGFVQFLRFLGSVPSRERTRIADVFLFSRFEDFQGFIRAILPLAYDLERLAPALANDGPNPEYPWPQDGPRYAPVTHEFDLWRQITHSGRGRQLLQVVERAIKTFPKYG